jgi:hypothetical protein
MTPQEEYDAKIAEVMAKRTDRKTGYVVVGSEVQLLTGSRVPGDSYYYVPELGMVTDAVFFPNKASAIRVLITYQRSALETAQANLRRLQAELEAC